MVIWQNTHDMLKEGWAIFHVDNRKWELEKCDEAAVFDDDCDAWVHVVKKALKGDAYCASAIEFLRAYEPAEYHRICKHTNGIL